jgi:hypothetical protein
MKCSTCGGELDGRLFCDKCQIKRERCVVCNKPTRGKFDEEHKFHKEYELDIRNLCPKCYREMIE